MCSYITGVVRRVLLTMIASGAAMACSSAYTAMPPTRIDRSRTLTASEIARSDALTAFEAIERLRPTFLMTRGATSFLAEPRDAIVVIADQMVLGGIAELRRISASSVTSIRRLSAADVYQKTGRSAPAGGLEVVTKPR